MFLLPAGHFQNSSIITQLTGCRELLQPGIKYGSGMEPACVSSGSEPRAQSSRLSCGSTQGSVWSLLKLALQVSQREVAGQTMTLLLCKVQGTGVQPSLGSFYHSRSRWGRLVPNCSQKDAQLGALATGLFLASVFYHKLPLQSPLPFLPSLLCPFSFLPSALYPAGQTGRVNGMVPGPVRQQGRTGVRCGITLPELHTQCGLSKPNLRVPVTNKENSLLPAN